MRKIISNLKELKKYGMTAVKQSLEDEGATFKDIEIMRKITLEQELILMLKLEV